MQMFSLLAWDSTGFIKTWCRMKSVELHNGRGTPMAHVVDGAPPPEYLYGDRHIVATARQRLIDHDIDPDKRHVEGNIAREIVLSASHEFFNAGSEKEKADRLSTWKAAQVPFLIDRFGKHRLVCAVLHQDEYTPHVHAIVLALKHGVDGRCPEKGPHWRLAGDALGRLGSWAQDHTAYARAMAPFGLKRGQEKSPNKNRPYGDRMAEVDAEQKAVAIARQDVAHQQKAVHESLIVLRDGWVRVRDTSAKLERERKELESAMSAAADLLKEAEEDRAASRAEQERLREQFRLLEERQERVAAREAAAESRERAAAGVPPTSPAGRGLAAQQSVPLVR